ncbi:MAG: RidA family protein [Pseudomonadota bacterium]
MTQTLINPASLFDGTAFSMSQAVLDHGSGLLFVSGQVDWDLDHQTSSDTIEGQLRSALENLRTVLDEAGCTPRDLLHLRLYIRGEFGEHTEAAAGVLVEWLDGARPALTGIGVASLASPETLVEIEAIARKPD